MIRCTILPLLLWAGLFSAVTIAEEASEIAGTSSRLRVEFARLDGNSDRRLSRAEFLQRPGRRAVLARDFDLYDFDSNQSLTSAEFAAVSGLATPLLRGRVPDPYDQLVADAVAALDQSYDHWDQRPGELVNAHTFVANFIGSISHGGKRYVTGRILRHADSDADGRLSRAEAKRFLAHQLGIRWHDGPPLREPTGRLVRFDRFLEMDEDQNEVLSQSEFYAGWPKGDSVEQDFARLDWDRNGAVTYPEFAHHASENYFDPIEWFRKADTNLDAKLDASEIAGAVDDSRRHLVASTFSAFDDDNDSLLSLQEYRLSMLGNVNYTWSYQPIDSNRNGQLTYDEFVFHSADLFQLQRRYYFHRLDKDENGALSLDEFEYRAQNPLSIHQVSIDGVESRQIYRSDDFPRCGWPTVSPDGKRILFHRYPRASSSGSAERREKCRIVVMNRDGTNVRDLCDGSNPSWSPDGKQFACVRKTEGALRIWIMGADGRSGLPLERGDCPRWSPAGSTIAFQHDHGIWLYDVVRAESRQIWRREDHPYQDLGHDIVWSPDSTKLAVLASRGAVSELVILPADRSDKARVSTSQPAFRVAGRTNLNWSSDGILFAAHDPGGLLALVSAGAVSAGADNASAPQRVTAFQGDGWKSACLTPDGKWYIAVSNQ